MYKVCTRGSFWTKSILGTSYYFLPQWEGGVERWRDYLVYFDQSAYWILTRNIENWLLIDCQLTANEGEGGGGVMSVEKIN